MALKQECEFLIDHIMTPCPTSYNQYSAVILLLIIYLNYIHRWNFLTSRAFLNHLYLTY